MNKIREKPIIFRGDMVRAILEGRKTVTRRVIKPQPMRMLGSKAPGGSMFWTPKKKVLKSLSIVKDTGEIIHDDAFVQAVMKVPHVIWSAAYGPEGALDGMGSWRAGMHAWVRETWALLPLFDDMRPSRLPAPKGLDLFWKADGHQTRYWKTEPGKWRPSIFMPRWASRITLEILDVRAAQLHAITEKDARAEGVEGRVPDPRWTRNGQALEDCLDYRNPFIELWNSINGKKPGLDWKSNPWVWRVAFKVL